MGMPAKHFITLININGWRMVFFAPSPRFVMFFFFFKLANFLTDQDGKSGLLCKMYKCAHARARVCVCVCVCVCARARTCVCVFVFVCIYSRQVSLSLITID